MLQTSNTLLLSSAIGFAEDVAEVRTSSTSLTPVGFWALERCQEAKLVWRRVEGTSGRP